MEKYLMAVRDKQAERFMTEFTELSIGMACRGFEDALKNPEVAMSNHPEDYDLYVLACLDTKSGEIILNSNYPMKVLSGLNVGVQTELNMSEKITKEEYHEAITPKEAPETVQ